MISFQRCVCGIGILLSACTAAFATPPLTLVQDTLFIADGTRFNGTATIAWPSFVASDGTHLGAHSISTPIVNGALQVQLVPTTNALSSVTYTVVYISPGYKQVLEIWAVPPSSVPLPVSAVRISSPGTIVGTGGTTPPPPDTVVAIAAVTGLSGALNLRPIMGPGFAASRAAVINSSGAVDGALGTLSDCLHVDGGSGPCGSSGTTPVITIVFVDGETPAGLTNGVNAAYSLSGAPAPATSLSLFRNGMLLTPGRDFSLANTTITFTGAVIPQQNDVLLASYRVSGSIPGVAFVDGEMPGGSVDGVNTMFTLGQAPNPVSGLALFRNGLRLRTNLDFTITGSSILFQPGLAPQVGDVLTASYRVAR